jgi:hypothetical protein
VHTQYGDYTEAHRRVGRIAGLLREIDALIEPRAAG